MAGVASDEPRPGLGAVFKIPDFRILWFGAFLSFSGSWVQNVAQGFYVYRLTGDEAKLALVSFASSFPVFLLGTLAGGFADTLHPRRVLFWTQILYAVFTLGLAGATYMGRADVALIILISALTGLVSTIELPVRQSVVGKVVPRDLLAIAVPAQAMTFNVARIVGPAVGGVLLARFGVAVCYAINGVSFLALAGAALLIRTPLAPAAREPQPIRDLLFEGALYTWREHRLRTLLILETVVAVFGIFYLPMLTAYVVQVLGFTNGSEGAKLAIGHAYTAVGVGALGALVLITRLSHPKHRGRILLITMACIVIGLTALSLVRHEWAAWPFLALVGGCTVVQFNSTNALFQLLAPERLRGRVLAMHIWALNGLSPFGVIGFGQFASLTRRFPVPGLGGGMEAALRLGAICVFVGLLFGLQQRRYLRYLE